jgi:hypothetical protein
MTSTNSPGVIGDTSFRPQHDGRLFAPCDARRHSGEVPPHMSHAMGASLRPAEGPVPEGRYWPLMNKKDHSLGRKGPLARSVSVVMLCAIFAVIFGHARAMESPAMASASDLSGNVFVVKGSPEQQLVLRAIPYRCNLLFSQFEIPLYVETQFLLRKERKCIYRTCRRGFTKRWTELGGGENDSDVWLVHVQVGYCSNPIIFAHGVENLFCFPEVFDTERPNTNIGTQLALLGLLHDQQLPLASPDLIPAVFGLEGSGNQETNSERDVNSDSSRKRDFNSKFYPFAASLLGVVFMIFFCKGFKRFVEGGGFLSGAAMMGLGWCRIW